MSTTPDFSGLDYCFALGEVYGLRTWRIDTYGRLRALHVTTAKAWRPGVNVATCHKQEHYLAGGLAFPRWYTDAITGSLSLTLGATPAPTPEPQKPEPQPRHETPDETCACGFYAYTEPSHEEAANYRGLGFVTGIVRGSGRTMIGTKGFRSEKAEIVALLDDTRAGKKTSEWRTEQAAKVARVYPDVPLLPSRSALLEFAPIETTLPDPSTDEFWALP